MRDYHINIFYSDEDEGYIADIPDLEACSAFGNTAEDALREVEVAREAWIETAESGRQADTSSCVSSAHLSILIVVGAVAGEWTSAHEYSPRCR